MAALSWTPDLELGVDRMDATHREFVALLAALSEASDETFAEALDRLIVHTVDHFGQEDRWMLLSGFGPMCHRTEHHNVLALMHEVSQRVAAGDLALGRRLATELAPWFSRHASTMDAILVSHMVEVGFDPATETPAPNADPAAVQS